MAAGTLVISPPEAGRPYAIVEGRGEPVETLAMAQVEHLFRTYGAFLLRDFQIDVAAFSAFANRLCPTSVHNESPGRETLDRATQIQTVNLGADRFPLHPELSREPWRPDACVFHCIQPDRGGGETTVCDGIAIVEALDPALVAAMAERRLLYMKPATPAVLRFWLGSEFPSDEQLRAPPAGCPYFFRRVGSSIIRGFQRPLLHRPMFDDRLAFANFLLFARDYLRINRIPVLDTGQPVPDAWVAAVREAAHRLTAPLEWQAGDVAVLDNSRFMHGRNPIRDPAGRRIASFFGYLDFAPAQPFEPADPIWRREKFRPPEEQAAT